MSVLIVRGRPMMVHARLKTPSRIIRLQAWVVLVFMGLMALSMAASAQSYTWLKNRWKPDQYINIEHGSVQAGQIQPSWFSAAWTLEPVPGTGFQRLRNRWKPEQYIHIENGPVQSGPIQPGWLSAMWTVEPVPGTPFQRLRSRWKPEQYLHIEQGKLQAGPIQPGWLSAMWSLDASPPGAAAGIAAAPPPPPQQPVQSAQVPTAKPAITAITPAPAAQPSAGAIAQRAIFGESEPDICWKETYGRGVGSLPDACPSGFERTGLDLLCYPVCRAGFGGVGPVCWQSCPAGFRNDGAFCAKPEAYGRGVGFAYVPLFESRDTARDRCEREHGRGNCERNLEMYYPVCRAGFKEFGSNICTPICPAGMTDIGVSCAKESHGRGVGEGATCNVGMQQDFKGGLCYPNCQPGTTGVGPVCWHGCPAAYPVNCGAACGVSTAACAFAIIEQVQSSADVALNVAALVATAGAATPALRAAQTAGRSARRTLTKTARDQLKEQAKNQLQNAMKWQKRGKQIARGQGWLDNASNVEQASEMLVSAHEKGEFDFTTLIPSVADVEPTGVLALVNSFNKPICR